MVIFSSCLCQGLFAPSPILSCDLEHVSNKNTIMPKWLFILFIFNALYYSFPKLGDCVRSVSVPIICTVHIQTPCASLADCVDIYKTQGWHVWRGCRGQRTRCGFQGSTHSQQPGAPQGPHHPLHDQWSGRDHHTSPQQWAWSVSAVL